MGEQIPQLFAMFDDDPSHRVPFYKDRFCLMWRRSGPMERLVTEPYTFLRDEEYATIEHMGQPSEPAPVMIGSNLSRWWKTGYVLKFHGTTENRPPIPVLDFIHRPPNSRLTFTLTAVNDDSTVCANRQVEQLALRLQNTPPVALPIVPPLPPPAPSSRAAQLSQIKFGAPSPAPAPRHVLEAFIRDAQTQKQTCPITCQEPSECDRVVVTNCYHWFDADALSVWCRTKKECPVCKAEIKSTTEVAV